MKKSIHLIVGICLASILFFSCKKDIPAPVIYNNPTNFSEVFEDFWNGMNINYVFWSIDTTNWDNMYKIYKPVFDNLNINDTNDVKKAISYFRQMTDGLVDSHYNISFTINPITDSFVNPAEDRKVLSSSFHNPFSYTSIDTVNYFDSGFVTGFYTNVSNEKIFASSGTIGGEILLFHCNGFSLQEAYQSATDNGVKNVLQYFFGQLLNLPASIKGIIIDVRNNGGGDVSDLNFLVGQLISKPLQFGYTRYKSGNGRLDYTPWITAVVTPQSTAIPINLPVIALADNFSISLAEATTMAIHTMPNGTFVGETTWGANGPLTENGLYNDGQFNVPDFLSVYTSSAEFKYINGQIYEGKGFPPDVAVPFNLSLLQAGDDPILDKAISLIH
jgi:carboxyl-terminal processing protease